MSKRVEELDILRLLFAIVILLHHSYFFLEGIRIFVAGSLGVDFFFMLSGYLMMLKIGKEDNAKDLWKKTVWYVFGKVRALHPKVLLAIVAGFTFLMMEGMIEANRNLWESITVTFVNDILLLKMLFGESKLLYVNTGDGYRSVISSLVCIFYAYSNDSVVPSYA